MLDEHDAVTEEPTLLEDNNANVPTEQSVGTSAQRTNRNKAIGIALAAVCVVAIAAGVLWGTSQGSPSSGSGLLTTTVQSSSAASSASSTASASSSAASASASAASAAASETSASANDETAASEHEGTEASQTTSEQQHAPENESASPTTPEHQSTPESEPASSGTPEQPSKPESTEPASEPAEQPSSSGSSSASSGSSSTTGGGSASDGSAGVNASGGSASQAAPEPEPEPPSEPEPEPEPYEEPSGITVYVSIESYNAHNYDSKWPVGYGSYTVTLDEGASVYDALCATGVGVSGSGSYVSAINGLAEKMCGSGSGWMYAVNGSFPNIPCGAYTLYGGESIRWAYTVTMGDV